MFRAPPPERRRRRDLVAAAAIVVLVAGAGIALGTTGDVAGTVARPAAVPIPAPPAAVGAPSGFAVAWTAPSPGTPQPVVAGPAVVTADGATVTGRDAVTGAPAWSYGRDVPLCTVGSGFPRVEEGRVLALYANEADLAPSEVGDGPYCSELTMLDAGTGARAGSRNPDARPGTRLIADDTFVLATGDDHLEVWRSDLVRTLEYGAVPAQEQVGRQPRPACVHGSTELGGSRVAVVERCPGETAERLTVLAADGDDGAEQPEERFSVPPPGPDTEIVALSGDRVAVASGGRLTVLDADGVEVTGPDPRTCDDPLTEEARLVRAGSDAMALHRCGLTPTWTVPDALGEPVRYGTDVLVPVAGGLLVVDSDGTPGRLLPVSRPEGPVAVAVQGQVVLEIHGTELVALTPVP